MPFHLLPALPLAAVLLFVGSCLPAALSSSHQFVVRNGSLLTLDGQPFFFAGANSYWLMDDAAWPDKAHTPKILFERAQALGLRVIRTWAFNYNAPTIVRALGQPPQLKYSEHEMQGLDRVVTLAAAHGIRLLLTVGNIWPHYTPPETFTMGAGLTGPGVDLLDFYANPVARALYRQHIRTLTSRVNSQTGIPYKDDPTIIGWDISNEPRCPGCTTLADQNTHLSWLREMSDTTKQAAPKQLVFLGTEGFFGLHDVVHKDLNPGAGSACEGEDWVKEGELPSVDVLTMHVYWRQTEGVPEDGWRLMGWHSYLSFFHKYLQVHERLSLALNKPLLLQEFNILVGRFSEIERDALFALAFDEVLTSQRLRGPLMGAMFWNAALRGVHPDTGYNIYVSDPIPPIRGSEAARQGMLDDPVIAITGANTTSVVSRSNIISTSSPTSRTSPPSLLHPFARLDDGQDLQSGVAAADGSTSPSVTQAGDRRRSLLQMPPADPFRRAAERAVCAEREARVWRPDPQRTDPSNVQVLRFLAKVAGMHVLGIIAEAAAAINGYVS